MDGDLAWEDAQRTYPVGSHVTGVVVAHFPFGAFVDLGCPYWGLIELWNFRDIGIRMTPEEYPAVGTTITAVVVGFQSHEIRLSARPSKLGQMHNELVWEDIKRTYPIGSLMTGVVSKHCQFGVFVHFGYPYEGLIPASDFQNPDIRMTFEGYPAVGTTITAVLAEFNDEDRRICLRARPVEPGQEEAV